MIRSVRQLLGCAISLGVCAVAEAEFQPRTAAERAEAFGAIEQIPENVRPLFVPDDAWNLIPLPESGDWLDVHVEPGQTFEEFRASHPNIPDAKRRFICLLPMGKFDDSASPELQRLRRFAEIYFQAEVKVLPGYDLATMDFRPRVNPQTKQVQILTLSVLKFLETRLPEDAFCLLGVTMRDLYPHDSWNYVFGQASLSNRVGIYSFARFDPDFFDEERPRDFRRQLLRRSCAVLAHETGHMFGLRHCIYFDCVMNGSNSLAESDKRSLHLCPVCLRKLYDSIRFDPARRYRELARFYREQHWEAEGAWCERQLEKIRAGKP
jgi:archaemetzincin